MTRAVDCTTMEYRYGFITLSVVICFLVCFVVTTAISQEERSTNRSNARSDLPLFRWVYISSAIFGCCVWSLHFVALLAFHRATYVAYDLIMALGSILVTVFGIMATFALRDRLPRTRTASVLPGILLGLSIVAMHYQGLSAMYAWSHITFDTISVTASVGLTLGFAIAALIRGRTLIGLIRRIEVAAWLALALCGLHFTATIDEAAPTPVPVDDAATIVASTQLGLAFGSVSLLVLCAGLMTLFLQRHLSQRSLIEMDRMRLLGDLAHEVLLIHRDGQVLEVNSAGSRLFGRPIEDIIGRPILDLFSEAGAPALTRRAHQRSEDLQPEEFEAQTATGLLVPVELSCRRIEFGGEPATAVALRDLSALRRDEARIRHLALHDALTDLPNRYLMEQRIGHALDVATASGETIAIIYLDLDRFKPINDLHGHATGDALLVQVAKRLLSELRASDTLARIGGDEFVVVLSPVPSPAHVSEVTGRLIAGLARPFHLDLQIVTIGASAGIALYPQDGRTVESLLRAADTALYRVKDEGRGGLRFFEASMNAQLHARRQLEQELSGAIDRDELQLFYQPIVNAKTGEIETFEALIRWRHPVRGLVSPVEFIPLAEQADLIAAIGQWVIDTACAAAATWPKPWRVSVNVSPSQFRQSDVPALAAAALARNALDANRLVIEITESVFIQDAANAVDVLSRLRRQGVHLALDDFGSGYSSLSYLQRFKFDKIKIDQSFVRRLGQSSDTLTIIHAIANLGHNLGLHVTVEGVETAEQLAILKEIGFDQMQGYLFGKPAPTLTVTDFEQARLRAMFQEPDLRAWA
ncbi:PAS domain S-box-containing protein/diguanylate cyclase (GGDEF) domain-containing protein [Methylobacterium gossipiicola]|uniref:PAS domain S-box-containing protein/diguanylate cyclase (GGDEF) domain-containing protein n=2 Tax=Methylobacterium gossipiicola TaxID=582675 RepID=A0A1I2WP85_9HYPH|nr:PAS domain S-box-containing protein/diguanylate cyclase (GGDEF) domain-containing protein [Methylobacterium gossipiicola]